MRFQFLLAALVSSGAYSAEYDAKVLRLIGDDAIAAYGADLERYANSDLSKFFPAEIPYPRFIIDPSWRAFAYIEYPAGGLAIYQGPSPPMNAVELRRRLIEEGEPTTALSQIGEIPTLSIDNCSYAILDSSTAIAGDTSLVQAAITRWRTQAPIGATATKVRELSANFDNWFYILRPLRKLEGGMAAATSKYQKQLVESIVELRGGFRTGGVNQFQIEALTQRTEDAITMAAMVRWLPGYLEAKGLGLGIIIQAIEDFDSRSSGLSVYVSFAVTDGKLREIRAAQMPDAAK